MPEVLPPGDYRGTVETPVLEVPAGTAHVQLAAQRSLWPLGTVGQLTLHCSFDGGQTWPLAAHCRLDGGEHLLRGRANAPETTVGLRFHPDFRSRSRVVKGTLRADVLARTRLEIRFT